MNHHQPFCLPPPRHELVNYEEKCTRRPQLHQERERAQLVNGVHAIMIQKGKRTEPEEKARRHEMSNEKGDVRFGEGAHQVPTRILVCQLQASNND